MATRPSFFRFGMAALLSCSATAAAAEPAAVYTRESFSGMAAPEAAERLLGRELAADVEYFEVQDLGLIGTLSAVRFFHRPTPLAVDICGRRIHRVSFAAAGPADADTPPSQVPTRPNRISEGVQIALAPGCRTAPGQSFASLNPGVDIALAIQALRGVAAARATAAGRGELPFRLTCRDLIGQGACRGDARSALAALPVQRAWLIQPPDEASAGPRIIIGEPGQLYWEVRLAGAGTDRELLMVRKAPAPF